MSFGKGLLVAALCGWGAGLRSTDIHGDRHKVKAPSFLKDGAKVAGFGEKDWLHRQPIVHTKRFCARNLTIWRRNLLGVCCFGQARLVWTQLVRIPTVVALFAGFPCL